MKIVGVFCFLVSVGLLVGVEFAGLHMTQGEKLAAFWPLYGLAILGLVPGVLLMARADK